jgi:hypothetical protein
MVGESSTVSTKETPAMTKEGIRRDAISDVVSMMEVMIEM